MAGQSPDADEQVPESGHGEQTVLPQILWRLATDFPGSPQPQQATVGFCKPVSLHDLTPHLRYRFMK